MAYCSKYWIINSGITSEGCKALNKSPERGEVFSFWNGDGVYEARLLIHSILTQLLLVLSCVLQSKRWLCIHSTNVPRMRTINSTAKYAGSSFTPVSDLHPSSTGKWLISTCMKSRESWLSLLISRQNLTYTTPSVMAGFFIALRRTGQEEL